MTTLRARRSDHHHIREMICETGDPDRVPELRIPRSTIRSWLHRDIPDVVTCDSLSAEKTELLAEIMVLGRCNCIGRSGECPEMQHCEECARPPTEGGRGPGAIQAGPQSAASQGTLAEIQWVIFSSWSLLWRCRGGVWKVA
jgi:hypothetical protein